MFTTGQATEGAVNYTAANAVGGKVTTGDDPTLSLNQANLTLPANQACSQPIGSKWIANVTNWLAYVIDGGGLTYLAGTVIDDPLLLLKAIKNLIWSNSCRFYQQATLPDVTNGYPCFFYNTGSATLAVANGQLGADIIPPGATFFYDGALWNLVNPGLTSKTGANLTTGPVAVTAGLPTFIPLTVVQTSPYVSFDGNKFTINATGRYLFDGTCGIQYTPTGAVSNTIFEMYSLGSGTAASHIDYLPTVDTSHDWNAYMRFSGNGILNQGDYFKPRITPSGSNVAVTYMGFNIVRVS